MGRKFLGIEKTCIHCSKVFRVSRSVNQQWGKFCSRSCQKAFHHVEKVCAHCTKTFPVLRSHVERGGGVYCSAVCQKAAKANEIITQQCLACGETYSLPEHVVRWRTNRFCSRRCYDRYRLGKNRQGETVCAHKKCPHPPSAEGLCEWHYQRKVLIEFPHTAPEYALGYRFKDKRKGHTTDRADEKELRQRYKIDVLAYYCKGKPCCQQCGFDDLRALCLDHINHDGAVHRQSISQTSRSRAAAGNTIYRWVKTHQYPEGFQVLCANCNMIKKAEYRDQTPGRNAKRL